MKALTAGHRAFERDFGGCKMFADALAAYYAEHGTCASPDCNSQDHTIWDCPIERAKDAELFARTFDGITATPTGADFTVIEGA